MEPLRIALLGLGGMGKSYWQEICADERLIPVALADRDPDVRRLSQPLADLPVFEDYRSLIVETSCSGLDLLVVTLPPFEWIELAPIALETKVPILCTTPIARSVEEGRRLMAMIEESAASVLLSNRWNGDRLLERMDEQLKQSEAFVQIHAQVLSAESAAGWRGDSRRAGGGALLYDGYDFVDLFVSRFGIPLSVHARCGTMLPSDSVRNYDTEDTAVVFFVFERGRTGTLHVSRCTAQDTCYIDLLGPSASVRVLPHRLTICPTDGSPMRTLRGPRTTYIARHLGELIAIARKEREATDRTLERQLDVLATIEAAYLSARTGEPESPASLLR